MRRHSPGYEDLSWPGCRDMLGSSTFVREMVLLQPTTVPIEDMETARSIILADPDMTPEYARRQSVLAASMLEWCIRAVQHYDEAMTFIEGSSPPMESKPW